MSDYRIHNPMPKSKGHGVVTRDNQRYEPGMRLYVVLDGRDDVMLESTERPTAYPQDYYADVGLAHKAALLLLGDKAEKLKQSLVKLQEWVVE